MNSSKPGCLAKSIILTIFWCLFLPTSYGHDPVPVDTDILFIANDPSESHAFAHIQQELKAAGIDYRILAIGPAAEVFRNDPALIPMTDYPAPYKVSDPDNLEINWHFIHHLIESISARVVYTGMSSRAQAQMANQWDGKGARVIAFYDSFEPVYYTQYAQDFMDEIQTINEFHVPSKAIAISFFELAQSADAEIKVIGHPSLEDWQRVYQQTDSDFIRDKLNIDPDQKVILFIADPEQENYHEAFNTFVETTRLLPDTLFLATADRRHRDDPEMKMLKRGFGNILLLNQSHFTTAALTTISSAIIMHSPHLAMHAVYKVKPVVYITTDDGFRNYMLSEEWAMQSSIPRLLARELFNATTYRDSPVDEKQTIPETFGHITLRLIVNELNRERGVVLETPFQPF